ncbi:hypothetical protein BGZ76_000674 [Entomortierella beljakovae]|nr:hypothetical protein BGZ76_000674 [Entomortierella beljakovae]
MSFPKDKKDTKGVVPEFLDAEEERRAFGQQAPYASSSSIPTVEETGPIEPYNSPIDSSSLSTAQPTSPSTFTSVPPSTGQQLQHLPPQNSSRPNAEIHQDEEDLNEADLPPSYDESQRIREPQQYQPENYSSSNSSPSAPLLGTPAPQGQSQAPQGSQYSSIPIPRSTPSHPPSISGSSISTESERSRRLNKFWIVFFLVILLLLIFSDDEDDTGNKRCKTGNLFTSHIIDHELQPDILDFKLSSTNVQQSDPKSTENLILYSIVASGSEYDDFKDIQHDTRVIRTDHLLEESLTFSGSSGTPQSECLGVVVKITFPYSVRKIKRLKFQITDGNITVNLLDPAHGTKVINLESRVITGHSDIRADVLETARLGASVGNIKGEIAVRKELVVNVVEGNVNLNLLPNRGVLVSNTISTTNGNINIGLDGQTYEGNFKLSTTIGSVDVINTNPLRTRIASISRNFIKGWSTENAKEPMAGSDMKLQTTSGNAILSLKPIEL